jgi:hypothetical protein
LKYQTSVGNNPEAMKEDDDNIDVVDPRTQLPRDETGCYLHLKLKRFSSIDDLSMEYAKTTWKKIPYDAAVGMATTGRSSCRLCHDLILKGHLRYQLLLQCHKGCKNSAYFHPECFFQYPETTKLTSVAELHRLGSLKETEKNIVMKSFEDFLLQDQRRQQQMKNQKKTQQDPPPASAMASTSGRSNLTDNMNIITHSYRTSSTSNTRKMSATKRDFEEYMVSDEGQRETNVMMHNSTCTGDASNRKKKMTKAVNVKKTNDSKSY